MSPSLLVDKINSEMNLLEQADDAAVAAVPVEADASVRKSIKTIMFDGSNFGDWKFQMETLLDANDLLECVLDVNPAGVTEESLYHVGFVYG
jgi:hypothetical protein